LFSSEGRKAAIGDGVAPPRKCRAQGGKQG